MKTTLGLLLLGVIGCVRSATIVDPASCTTFPCLIFDEEFETLDHDVWQHEITAGGGGNWEFQVYLNNRSLSYTRDGTLFIKPELTSNWKGESFLTSGDLNIWGQGGRGAVCTAQAFYGCERQGTPTNIVNPIMSARLRTSDLFSFRYGRVVVRAQMPRGNWLWPAIWLLPEHYPFGDWPSSGEIDLVESRGNDHFGTRDSLGNTNAGSTLHWGPYYSYNEYERTHADYSIPDESSFGDDFLIWTLDWTDEGMTFTMDGEEVLNVDPVTNFWDFGEFDTQIPGTDNVWGDGGKMTPFDQKFYFVINLAVGGTGGFFPDSEPADPPKPWEDDSATASLDFWNARDDWLPSWEQGEGRISEGAALKVDYVKVYKVESVEM